MFGIKGLYYFSCRMKRLPPVTASCTPMITFLHLMRHARVIQKLILIIPIKEYLQSHRKKNIVRQLQAKRASLISQIRHHHIFHYQTGSQPLLLNVALLIYLSLIHKLLRVEIEVACTDCVETTLTKRLSHAT